MSDKREDSPWVTAVIITRVREVEKGWRFIYFFKFNLAWNLTTDSQTEIELVWYKSLYSIGIIPQTPILNDDLQRATKRNMEEVYRKERFESWTRKGAWK